MNNLITHFTFALRKAWVEKRVNVLRLGQFVLATVILSFAFGSAFQTSDFEKVDIAYSLEDATPAVEAYFDQLTENEDLGALVEFHEVGDFDDGRAKVQDDDFGAFVYATTEFAEALDSDDEQATLEVYSQQYSGINYIVVSSVVDAYNSGANATWAAQQIGTQIDPASFSTPAIEGTSVEQDRAMTSLIYYSVGMLLFLLLFATEFGSFGISDEYLGTMQARSMLAPQKQWQMILGKLSAYSVFVLAMAALYMLATSLLLKMDWGPNLGLVLLVVYTFAVLSIALGMVFMVLTRDMQRTTVLIQVVVIGFTLLAGGFIATGFGGLERISPNLYARDALFAAIFDDRIDEVWSNLGVLWVITAVLIAVCTIASSRRAKA
ncbi:MULTISPECIES: ABC transporter permease [Curtobacterium]|uniref:ABC transporter permease n=1 Tax=Curtobacterium TaxID=2034 RepID=UPI00254F9AE5|nr:ABC transporter permease [Curtobacterium sp. ME-Dv--P-122a]